MEHHHSHCEGKTAYERTLWKVKDQLDLLEEPILSGEMSGFTLFNILRTLIEGEEQRTTPSASASSSSSSSSSHSNSKCQSQFPLESQSSCGKTDSARNNNTFTSLTLQKGQRKENDKKGKNSEPELDSDSDSDIEIIEVENAVESKERCGVKRRLNSLFNEAVEEGPCKKLKPAENQTKSTSIWSGNSEQRNEENDSQLKEDGELKENEPEPEPEPDAEEEQAEEDGDKEPQVNQLDDEEAKEPSVLSFSSTATKTKTKPANKNDQDQDQDGDFLLPISYPKVYSSFWRTGLAEEESESGGVEKLVIHNLPPKLGNDLNDLWFLVNWNSKPKFIYIYRMENLTRRLNCICRNRLKLWLQLQTANFQNGQIQLESFLSEFGKFVTHFTFERRNGEDENEKLTQEQFSRLIFEKLCNVQWLLVDENFISPSTSPSNDDRDKEAEKPWRQQRQRDLRRRPRELSHLKTIQFISSKFKSNLSPDFIEPIIKLAPNLKFIYDLPLKFFRVVKSLGKMDQIKSVKMNNNSKSYGAKDEFEKDLETLSMAMSTSASKMALEKLVIPVYFNEPKNETAVEMNYQRFFRSEASRNSLGELHIEPTKLVDWSEFGRLENLSTLQINIFRSALHFSDELKIHKVFPRLKSLVINYLPDKNKDKNRHMKNSKNSNNKNSGLSPSQVFDTYFPPGIFIPGKSFKLVSELKLTDSFPAEWMKKLRILLPEIFTLTWNCGRSKFREILELSWSLWAGLTALRFEIDLAQRQVQCRDDRDFDFDFEYADSALLGLPEEICEKLRNRKKIRKAFAQGQKKPSILSLKKLERFEISVQPPSCAEKDAETKIFSPFASSRALSKMRQINPEFQLQITFHPHCSSKYVQSVKRDLHGILAFVNH